MDISVNVGDRAIVEELGRRVRQTRLRRNITQSALAKEAGVSRATVERLETGESIALVRFVAVLRVLGLLDGLEALVPELGPSAIQQLDLRGKQRERARGEAAAPPSPQPGWRWGDEEPSD